MDSKAQGNHRECESQRESPKAGMRAKETGLPPQDIWILGAGRFGRIAAKRLTARYPQAALLVVDQHSERLNELHSALGVAIQHEDAIDFISRVPIAEDQWIVPAVPVHVAFQWLIGQLRRKGALEALTVPEAVDLQVPNPYRVASGTLYASFATFLCPDACAEPEKVCTYTGHPRLGNLFERLAGIKVPDYRVEVIRSWQLSPGVGGYRGAQLQAVLQALLEVSGRAIVATSCRCHAVIDALTYDKC